MKHNRCQAAAPSVPPSWVLVNQWSDGEVVYSEFWTGTSYIVIEDIIVL